MVVHMIIGAICSVLLLYFCRKHIFKSGKNFLLVVLSMIAIFSLMQNWDFIAQLRVPTSLSSVTFAPSGTVVASSSTPSPVKVVATPSPRPRSQPKQKGHLSPSRKVASSSTSDTPAIDNLLAELGAIVGSVFLFVIIVLIIVVSLVSRRHRQTPLSGITGSRCLECGHNKPVKEYRYRRGRGQLTGQICEDCAGNLHATAV